MYLDHFGLNKLPFKITPDTTMFYSGSQRGAILEALQYAINSGEGIIKLVSEVGSGKTMMCRMLELNLPKNIELVYLANPNLSPENILFAIAHELRLSIDKNTDKLDVMQKLHQYLLHKHSEGIQVVVFVEEAQVMPLETLEEIRLLSNLETTEDKLLQIVLFGQPELDDKLAQDSIRQLRERISHNFCLRPFDSKEVYEYLNHRMATVGYRGPEVFSYKRAKQIQKATKGLTRRINLLADKTLLSAFSESRHQISAKDVKLAIADNNGHYYQQQKSYSLNAFFFLVSLLIVAICLFYYRMELKEALPDFVQVDLKNKNDQFQNQQKSNESMINTPVAKKTEINSTSKVINTQQVKSLKAEKSFEKERVQKGIVDIVDKNILISDYPLIGQLLEANKQRYIAVNKNFFSIQILTGFAGDEDYIESEILKILDPFKIEQLYLLRTKNVEKNLAMYALEYGVFKTNKAAKSAYDVLPDKLKRYKPYIKKKFVKAINSKKVSLTSAD